MVDLHFITFMNSEHTSPNSMEFVALELLFANFLSSVSVEGLDVVEYLVTTVSQTSYACDIQYTLILNLHNA